jgi:hypothetical protein
MLKDIFIDNSIAKNFSNPLDPSYKHLVTWLMQYQPTKVKDNAHLVWSNKLLREYHATAASARSDTNIVTIVNTLTRQGRFIKISNQQIKEFKREYFKKYIVRRFRCNAEDRDHIPTILLSYRKYALIRDQKFIYDVNNFPGFTARAADCPEDLPYDS